MRFYLETTKWTTPTTNHIYLLTTDKSKMVGYVRAQDQSVMVFRQPIKIDVRGRTFKPVPELGEINLDELEPESWRFTGSKGDVYVVQKIDGVLQCSCPGHKYRGECKHVKEVEHGSTGK